MSKIRLMYGLRGSLWKSGVELKRKRYRISKNQLPMRVHGATKQASEDFAILEVKGGRPSEGDKVDAICKSKDTERQWIVENKRNPT